MMKLERKEILQVQRGRPLEVLAWDAEIMGALDCAFLVPGTLKPELYELVFEGWSISHAIDEAGLHYRVESQFFSYSKKNLSCPFNLKSGKHQSVLARMLSAQQVYLYPLSKNSSFLRKRAVCEWPPQMRTSLRHALEEYAQQRKHFPRWLDCLKPPSLQEKVKLEEVKVILPDNKVQEKLTVTTRPAAIVTRPDSPQTKVATDKSSAQELELPATMPLIERCIYHLQNEQPNDTPSWNSLLIAGLEQARLFTWEREALDLLESRRQALKEIEQPVLSSSFPYSLLWFEMAAPMKTPVCSDVAAMFLFSATAKSVYKAASLKALPLEEVTRLRKNASNFERNRLSILVINSQGKLVWSMSLPSTLEEARTFQARPWLVPQWFRCPQHKCGQFVDPKKLGGRMLYWNLCPICKEGQIFFSTWIMIARQALLGQYRNASVNANALDDFGTRRVEHVMDDNAYTWLRAGRVRNYAQIVTYKDISQSLTSWKPEIKHRGSWVEALKSIDPTLVTEKVQYVAEHKRRFMSERFTNMRGQEITIESFSRSSPVRADLIDVPRKTEVVAKADKNNAKKRKRRYSCLD